MTVQDWWKEYGWEPSTGPVRNTLIPDTVPDAIRDAWRAGANSGNWHKYPDEKPAKEGLYIVFSATLDPLKGGLLDKRCAWWDGNQWSEMECASAVTHWCELPEDPSQ